MGFGYRLYPSYRAFIRTRYARKSAILVSKTDFIAYLLAYFNDNKKEVIRFLLTDNYWFPSERDSIMDIMQCILDDKQLNKVIIRGEQDNSSGVPSF